MIIQGTGTKKYRV